MYICTVLVQCMQFFCLYNSLHQLCVLPPTGMVEDASPLSRLPPPTASPRKKLRKADKEQKRQPQRRAPPPPPAGAKVKEVSLLPMLTVMSLMCQSDVTVM